MKFELAEEQSLSLERKIQMHEAREWTDESIGCEGEKIGRHDFESAVARKILGFAGAEKPELQRGAGPMRGNSWRHRRWQEYVADLAVPLLRPNLGPRTDRWP